MKKIFRPFLFTHFLFLPATVFAGLAKSYETLTNPAPFRSSSNELECLSRACDIKEFFLLIVRDFLQLIPVVAVLTIVMAGVKMVIAGGNQEKISEAKRMLLWAVLGLGLSFMAFSIVAITQNLIQGNT